MGILDQAASSSEGGADERRAWVRRPRTNFQLVGVYAALLVMWFVLTIASPYFLTVQNVRSLLIAASTLSHHLQKLIQVDLVTQERQATTLICRANYPVMETLIGYLTEECCMEERSCKSDAA